jgi:hypothetical protein
LLNARLCRTVQIFGVIFGAILGVTFGIALVASSCHPPE